MAGLVEELLAAAEAHLRDLVVDRVVIGLAYTAVLLSDRRAGVAATLLEGTGCRVHPRAGELAGRPARALAQGLLSPDPLEASLGLAVVNAVLGEDAGPSPDPVEAMGVKEGDVVGVVGYIGPLVGSLRKVAREVLVFERNRSRPGTLPDWAVETELPRCDVVYITGTAFANKTIGRLLGLCRGRLAVVGPSTPMRAGLLERGIDYLFGARVRDPEAVLRAVSEGGGTKALFHHGLEKIALGPVRSPRLPG